MALTKVVLPFVKNKTNNGDININQLGGLLLLAVHSYILTDVKEKMKSSQLTTYSPVFITKALVLIGSYARSISPCVAR